MQAFEYANPATLQEACGLLSSQWGETDVLAGGTDLLGLMKDYIHTPKRVVNIKGVKELDGIAKAGGGVRIGSVVTLDAVADNALLRKDYPSLVEAARGVASQQIRNMGTVGGDLCQRPRCWYFRAGYGLLAKDKDGKALVPDGENKYHAIFGNGGPAYFVSASSFGPALIALGAKVRLVSAKGKRDLPVESFFVTPARDGEREIAMRPDEILTEILIPSAQGIHNATYEVRQQEGQDWPLATASVALKMKGNTVTSARVVLGHVAPAPWTAQKAEQALAGKSFTDALADEAAGAAVSDAKPLSQNAYKVQLARVAVKRALLQAARGRA